MNPNVKRFIIGAALVIAAFILISNNNAYFANQHHIEWLYTFGGIAIGLIGLFIIFYVIKKSN